MTDQSVRRYAKVGRVQDLPNKMSPSQTRYCQWAEKNMERVFLGQVMINPEDVSWPDVFTIHDRPRRFCLELFAGTARVSSAVADENIPIFPVDICLFPSHNLLQSEIASGIFNFIRQHRVMMIWLGMPCTTFSRAKKLDGRGPPPLRTSEHIWGLENLRPHDRRKLLEGNQLFRFTMKILQLCEEYRIPYILENPLTSMAWEMPPLQDFVQQFQSSTCILDFCMFGEIWKKPTQLLYNRIDISILSKRCSGTHLKCSRSKRPHRALTGTDSNGVFWTLRAQPYPWPLVSKFGAIVAGALLVTAR